MNPELKEWSDSIAKQNNLSANLIAIIVNYLFDDETPHETAAISARLMMNEVQPMLDAEETCWSELDYYRYEYSELIYDCAKAQAAGLLENRHVKKILKDCFNFPYVGYSLITYCRETGILNEASGDELYDIVRQVMLENPIAVNELRNGKEKAIGSLVGAVMKKQKANPVEIQKLIRGLL